MKNGRRHTTKWNAFFLSSDLLISLTNGFLIVPLYLKHIDHSLYGAWLATGNILMWLTLIDPGVGDVLIQKISYAEGRNEKKEIGMIILSGILISFIISGVCFIVGWILSEYIPALLKNGQVVDYKILIDAFRLSIIATSINLFTFSLGGTLLGLQKTKTAGLSRNISGITGICTVLYFLLNGHGLLSIPYGYIVRATVLCSTHLALVVYYKKSEKIKLTFNWMFFKSFSRIFSYTFFSKLFLTLANHIDLIIVARLVDVNTVTVFELTRRPLKFLKNFINLPSFAMLPGISNMSGEGKNESLRMLISRYLKIFNWILFGMVASYILFNEHLVSLWIGSEFYLGDTLNMLIGITFLFTSLSYNLSNINYAIGDIKGNSLINIAYSTIYLLLIYIFGKLFGIAGIIITPLISTVSTYLWYFPKKLLAERFQTVKDMKEQLIEFVKLALLSLTSLICFIIIRPISWLELFIYGSLYLILFSAILYLLSPNFRIETSAGIAKIKSKII